MNNKRHNTDQVFKSLSDFIAAEGEGDYLRRLEIACRYAVDTISGWSLLYIILGIPFTFLFFCFPALLMQVISGVPDYYSEFAIWEKRLQLSAVSTVIILFALWMFAMWIYRIGKRSRMLAYKMNQCMLLTLLCVCLYPIFYRGMRANSSFALRVFEWIFLLGNIILAIIFAVKRDSLLIHISQNGFVLGALLLFFLIRLIFAGIPFARTMEDLRVIMILAVFSILPDIMSIVFHLIINGILGQIILMNDVLRDQEHWRNEFNYSKEDWYGPRHF